MASKKKAAQQNVSTVEENVIPATIVEGSEEQVFAPPVEGQEVVTSVVETPAPEVKKERINRRPYIQFVQESLEDGVFTRKEIIEEVMKRFPATRLGGIQTFVTDLKNPKYSHFKDRKVVQQANGKLIFEDKLASVEETPPTEVVVPEEVQTTEAPSEQAGE
jgi:hypothetical protein